LIGLSGSTGWQQTSLNLADVPKLGSLIGKSSVWFAFGFTSDSTGTRRGVFVDDVEVQKASTGTGISGYLKGSLSPAGNPYIAFDHIGVAIDDTLVIKSGVEIRFENSYGLFVNGFLEAVGTEVDSIIFTSNSSIPHPGDWIGLEFDSKAGSEISYSKIEYAGTAIYCAWHAPKITNNRLVNNNNKGIYLVNTGTIIKNNSIEYNEQEGISHSSGTLSTIEYNHIKNNGSGIKIYWCSANIWNNIIEDNNQAGVSVSMSTVDIRSNKIGKNSTGITISGSALYGESEVTIIDNIVINNSGDGIDLGYGNRLIINDAPVKSRH